MSLEYAAWRKSRRVIGACDICNAQKVEIAMKYVSGIQTFYCAEGCQPQPTEPNALLANL